MRHVALLIGAQTYDLTGVGNDVDTMSELLGRRGFTSTRCEGPLATRAGILDAYERLIRDTRPDDAVVVYYSGHGGLAVAPPALAPAGRTALPRLQFIVPTDYAESTSSDFRGITAAELSVLLVRLANRTDNITVVLDACHAAHLSRGDDLLVKALRQRAFLDVAEHLSRQRRRGLHPEVRHVLGNQSAVRVVACGRDRSAYEYTDRAGRRVGVFTEAVARTLAETGDQQATWAGLLPRIRARVSAVVPWQRPEAEGPAQRLLFRSTGTRLGPGPDRPPLHASVTVEWGRVCGGRPVPLPPAGVVVPADEYVYVRVGNDGDRTVHVSVLEFDALSQISVVTSLDPSGVPLGPGEEQVIGRDELDGRLAGFQLSRPPDGGDTTPCPAALVVLVASAPAAPIQVFRDLAQGGPGPVRHDVHRFSFRRAPVRQ